MAARLKLYIDWTNKRLQQGLRNTGTFNLPTFFQGDIVPVQVYLLEPDPDSGPTSFSKIDISNIALLLAVNAAPPVGNGVDTPIITQYTWQKNTQESYFYADVAFNTAGVGTLLGASASAPAYLEIEATEGAGKTTLIQQSITIKAEIIEAGSLSVAAPATPLSLEVAMQLFAMKRMGAGETLTLVGPGNAKGVQLGANDDGSLQTDTIDL
jgi:hypothetical protein